MMKITVVGATGSTGIHLVTELRKTVASVRVIARSTDRLVRLFPETVAKQLLTIRRVSPAALIPTEKRYRPEFGYVMSRVCGCCGRPLPEM
jgi:nucleoside-diphosphate-sugar epimerase